MNTAGYSKIKSLETPGDIFDLTGRVGIIVGGAGKMGQQFAKVLSLAGAQVVIADVNGKTCEELAHKIESDTGGKLMGLGCDVSSQEQVHDLF